MNSTIDSVIGIWPTNISNEREMCGQLYVSCVWVRLFVANWKVKPDVVNRIKVVAVQCRDNKHLALLS